MQIWQGLVFMAWGRFCLCVPGSVRYTGKVGQQHSSGWLLTVFVRIYSAKVHIAQPVSCVYCSTHLSSCVCVVWQLFMERNDHFYVQIFRHEHLQAIHEPGLSEKPAVTRRKPEHQNNLRTEINPINKCRNVICGFTAHFSALYSQHWITLLHLFCAVN